MRSLGWLFAFIAGALMTCQVGSNSQVKKSLGQPSPALIVNYVLGITAVLLYTFVKQVPFPSAAKAFRISWWGWLSGIFGAVYCLTAIILASQLGAVTLTALVVTGQQTNMLCQHDQADSRRPNNHVVRSGIGRHLDATSVAGTT